VLLLNPRRPSLELQEVDHQHVGFSPTRIQRSSERGQPREEAGTVLMQRILSIMPSVPYKGKGNEVTFLQKRSTLARKHPTPQEPGKQSRQGLAEY
jgi:hypothetical protein